VAKKRKKKGGLTCLNCGSRMKQRDMACRKRGAGRPGSFAPVPGSAKAVLIPHIGKAFAAKSALPRCGRCGNASRRDARRCASCGSVLALAVVSKSADFLAKRRAEPDPVSREVLFYQAHPEFKPPWAGGGAS
jgi:ssDNA-binding Zn-finger/Zn-ribbon topoisomerase 1